MIAADMLFEVEGESEQDHRAVKSVPKLEEFHDFKIKIYVDYNFSYDVSHWPKLSSLSSNSSLIDSMFILFYFIEQEIDFESEWKCNVIFEHVGLLE